MESEEGIPCTHIGKRQATTKELRDCIQTIQSYFRGESIDVGTMQSPIRWIDPDLIPPVPMDVACTGPKTIQMACEVSERVSFAVGSAHERVSWAMDTALEHIEKIGRERDEIKLEPILISYVIPTIKSHRHGKNARRSCCPFYSHEKCTN